MRNQKKPELLIPTFEQLERARTLFEAYEPRELFYRAATELVELAFAGKTKLSVTESIAVLLQTWNSQYYRFHTFGAEHFRALEAVLSLHHSTLVACRPRLITSFTSVDFSMINELFTAFELVLGPVGAAKALHLLAPHFFPLWDRKIAQSYGIGLTSAGQNSAEYLEFMTIVLSQVAPLLRNGTCDGLLKRIDEYNYCRFTKGWLMTA